MMNKKWKLFPFNKNKVISINMVTKSGKKEYAKRTGGDPNMPDMKGKGQSKGLAITKTDKKRRDAKRKAKDKKEKSEFLKGIKKDKPKPKEKGKSVSALRKEASVIRKSLTPKPISKMKKGELETYIAKHRGQGKSSIAPKGLG